MKSGKAGWRWKSVSLCPKAVVLTPMQLPVWCQTVWHQLQSCWARWMTILTNADPVCAHSHSSFCRLNMNIKGSDQPTSSSEKHDSIEHRRLLQLLQNLRPRDAEGLEKRRPDCVPVPPAVLSCLRKACINVQQRRARTLGRGISDCATNCILQHASKRDIVLI